MKKHLVKTSLWQKIEPGFNLNKKKTSVLNYRRKAQVSWVKPNMGILVSSTKEDLKPQSQDARTPGQLTKEDDQVHITSPPTPPPPPPHNLFSTKIGPTPTPTSNWTVVI